MTKKKVKTRHGKKVGEGTTKSVLKGLIPGIGSLVEKLEESSEAFRERLKEVDREVESKLRQQSLKRAKPIVETGYKVRTIRKEKESTHPRVITKKEKVELEELKEKKVLVDVFNEEDKIRIVAELPGIKEGDIKIALKGKELMISAGKYYKKIKLPYLVEEKISKSLRHGILEIILNKKRSD